MSCQGERKTTPACRVRHLAEIFVIVVGLIAGLLPAIGTAWAQNGNALDFSGDDDYVELSNESQFDFSTTMTVEAWIWVREFDTYYQAIVTKGDYSWRIQHGAAEDGIEFSCDTSSGNLHLYGTTGVNDGLWHHVAGVFDSVEGTITLYVDGVIDRSEPASGTINNDSYPVLIGGNSTFPPPSYEWNGRIDEVRIWSIARSQAEIRATMSRSLTGVEAGLVAYYQFDEGVAGGDNSNPPVNMLPDLTANGNSGVLHNFALMGDTSNWIQGAQRSPAPRRATGRRTP